MWPKHQAIFCNDSNLGKTKKTRRLRQNSPQNVGLLNKSHFASMRNMVNVFNRILSYRKIMILISSVEKIIEICIGNIILSMAF